MQNELKHLAIIMDGNGRWAKAQGKDRSYGHRKGAENMKKLALKASKLGIEVLTLFAFSTENWSRSEQEVNYLMRLPGLFFDAYMKEIQSHNIRVEYIGFIDELPEATKKVVNKSIVDTKNNTGMILNLAVNYGSRQEIVQAVKDYTQAVLDGKRVNDLKVEEFDQYLMTSNYPDVDLLIRTSGEYRLSNFLLWQISYSELYFTEIAFPDFNEIELEKAVLAYSERHRRFGG